MANECEGVEMKSRLFVFLLPPLIAGCATSREILVEQGLKGYFINCTGSALSWRKCLDKAEELCGGKAYEVLEQSKEQGAVLSFNQGGLVSEPVPNRSITVRCKR